VDRVLRELEQSQHWPVERLRERQFELQRALLRHAWNTVPYYREAWGAAGFEPGDLRGPDDWARLPTVDKVTLQEHGSRMTSSAAPPGLKSATSGSSGMPVGVLRGHLSWAHTHANYFRHWRWHGIQPGDRYAYFWGLALDAKGRREAALKDAFFNRSRCSPFELTPARAREFYDLLRRDPARFALGYPSAVTQFADEVAAQGLDGHALGWRAVVTTSEVLHPHRRERIESAFGCRVIQHYGAAEIGVASMDCERGTMHIAVESVVMDLVPQPDGGPPEVLLTDLHNFSEPVIRYRIGDLVEPLEGCACGRGLPVHGPIQGRAGDTIELPDGRRVNGLLPYYIFRHHAKSGRIREYQFVQFPGGRIELRVTPGKGWEDAMRTAIEAEVTRGLGVPIEVRVVPRFERRGRGKHRDFVKAEDLNEDGGAAAS
jgi:phenylacetate-CoA ligase